MDEYHTDMCVGYFLQFSDCFQSARCCNHLPQVVFDVLSSYHLIAGICLCFYHHNYIRNVDVTFARGIEPRE